MTSYALSGDSPNVPADGDFWIAPDATVVGRVKIEAGCSVWFGAVIRGDNEEIRIGTGTNIQDLCVLHSDFGFQLSVGAGCTIGHRAILHGCTIGDDTLVGMGTVILNGAKIGKNCLIGAGSLIPEGKEIPNGSLAFGSPAKVVRPLTQKEIGEIELSAVSYRKNMQRFARHLGRV